MRGWRNRLKGYYIFFEKLKEGEGVSNKVLMQLEEFRKYFDITLIESPEKNGKRTFFEKLEIVLPFHQIKRIDYQAAFNKLNNPDFVYIRRTTLDIGFYNFLKNIRKSFPNCKIIIEIFTYPYDVDEFGFHRGKSFLYYYKDVFYRNRLKNIIDRVVTYTDDKQIFGIETIQTINGTNLNTLEVIPHKSIDNKIHLLSCAFFQRHHGYERILRGLKKYYKSGGKKDICIDFVGEGFEIQKYKKLSSCKELENRVFYHGKKKGTELDFYYSIADIALSSFAMHSLKLKTSSALKTREYMAKGIPFIAGSKTDVMIKNYCPYYLEFPADNSPIDINKVIEFYEKIENDREKGINVGEVLHSFAKEHCSMEKSLSPIISYIKG